MQENRYGYIICIEFINLGFNSAMASGLVFRFKDSISGAYTQRLIR